MRQIVYILILALCFGSCNKEDRSTETTYQVMVKENFTDPHKQYENIMVDDYIPYLITIEDRDTNSEKAEYRLTPLYEGQPYHQMLWKDFGLYSSNEDKTTLKEEKYISFSKKGTHYFYIRPFVPGTFKHTYELQKFVEGKAVGKAIKLNINFNAVNIKFVVSYFYTFLSVEDGENETDKYLSAEGTTQYYKVRVRYKDNDNAEIIHRRVQGILKEDGWTFLFQFSGGITIEACEQLTIEQKAGNLPPFVIDYYNIKIEKTN